MLTQRFGGGAQRHSLEVYCTGEVPERPLVTAARRLGWSVQNTAMVELLAQVKGTAHESMGVNPNGGTAHESVGVNPNKGNR